MSLARGSREPQLRLRLFSFAGFGMALAALACARSQAPRVVEAAQPDEMAREAPSNEAATAPSATLPPATPSAPAPGIGGGGVGWGRIGLGNARPSHQSDVDASLHRQRAAWRSCRADSVAPTMDVRITVDARGRITSASRIAAGPTSSEEIACVLSALRQLTVPPPHRAPHAVEVTLQLVPDVAIEPPSLGPGAPDAAAPGSYPDRLLRTIGSARGAFRTCAERYLRCCPNLSDRVALAFTIEKDGSVTHATAGPDTTVPDGEARCVLDALRSLTFPPPPEGRIVVRYPVRFSPEP